jgi:hypothetical protein
MLTINKMLTNNSILKYSVLFLLCGLSLAHFTTIYADEHKVFNENLSHFISSCIFFLFFCLFFYTLIINNFKTIHLSLYLIAVALILIESLILFKKSGFLPEQLIEHALKIMLPLIGVFVLNRGELTTKTLVVLKILIACTFLGHGVYALGVHYIPRNFMSMTTTILCLDKTNAENFLFLIGILDILAAIGIFFKGIAQKSAFIYMILWGLITAFARIIYGSLISTDSIEFLYYVSNAIYRIPNGLIPLFLFNEINKRFKYK